MELRLRKVFSPLGYLIAVILRRADIQSNRLIALSYITAFIALFCFYLLSSYPYSTALKILIVFLIFLSGLLDEIVTEFKKLRSSIGELERINLIIDRYSDILIILAAVYYLDDQIYTIILKGIQFQISVSQTQHLVLGGLIVAGILLLNLTEKTKKTLTGAGGYGLETRGERMFLLSLFAFTGLYYDFDGSLFTGLLILNIFIYIAVIRRYLTQHRQSRHISYSRHPLYRTVRHLAGTATGLTNRVLVRAFIIGLNIIRVLSTETVNFIKKKYALFKKIKTDSVKIRAESKQKVFSPFSLKKKKAGVENVDAGLVDYTGVPGHNFTVVVTDENTKFPIPDARVVLKNKEIDKEAVRYTDESGRCDFKDIMEGQYSIKITSNGFKEEGCERYISMDSGEVFTLKEQPVDLSVVVSDREWATPISNAQVHLVLDSSKSPGSGRRLKGLKRSKRTDNLGVAYFEGLSRKVYEIAVEMKGYETEKIKVDLKKENVAAVNLKKVSVKGETIEPRSYSKLLGESALIEFTSTGEVEDVLMKIIEDYLDKKRDVVLVSAPPRTAVYKMDLKNEISEGKVRVINLVTSGHVSGDYDELTEIPMTNLEYFKTVFERMPAGSTMIFEPLSNLILNTNTDLAYKFISKTVDNLSNEGLCFVCLLNVEGHEEKEIGRFRNLFMNLLHIDGDRLVKN